jgi:glutaredoxin
MTLLSPLSPQHKIENNSPYCSDPNCVYCKELKAALERIELGKQFRLKEQDNDKGKKASAA